MTKGVDARERVRARLMAIVNDQFPNVWVRVTRLELGPPVGFPVQFRIVGPDTQKVREIAREVEAVVAASPKVRDVQLDWNDPVRTLESRPRPGQGTCARPRARRRLVRHADAS